MSSSWYQPYSFPFQQFHSWSSKNLSLKSLQPQQSWAILSNKGPYIKDVHTKGGGGVSPKADIVREVAWIYCYRSSQNADKGGGGPKSRKFCGRPLCMVPKKISWSAASFLTVDILSIADCSWSVLKGNGLTDLWQLHCLFHFPSLQPRVSTSLDETKWHTTFEVTSMQEVISMQWGCIDANPESQDIRTRDYEHFAWCCNAWWNYQFNFHKVLTRGWRKGRIKNRTKLGV